MDNIFIVVNRDQHSRDFTVLSNQMLRDISISYHARYLMAWLLSFNPKPGFKYSVEYLSHKVDMPLTRVRTSIQELRNAGYIKFEKTRNGARYGHSVWCLYETPIKSVKKEAVQEEDTPIIAEVISTEQFNFEQFWNKYPKKVNRDAALKAFLSIPDVNIVFSDIMSALDTQIRSKQWQEENGRYIPSPENYLKKRLWNSVIKKYTDEEFLEMMEDWQ